MLKRHLVLQMRLLRVNVQTRQTGNAPAKTAFTGVSLSILVGSVKTVQCAKTVASVSKVQCPINDVTFYVLTYVNGVKQNVVFARWKHYTDTVG